MRLKHKAPRSASSQRPTDASQLDDVLGTLSQTAMQASIHPPLRLLTSEHNLTPKPVLRRDPTWRHKALAALLQCVGTLVRCGGAKYSGYTPGVR